MKQYSKSDSLENMIYTVYSLPHIQMILLIAIGKLIHTNLFVKLFLQLPKPLLFYQDWKLDFRALSFRIIAKCQKIIWSTNKADFAA